MRRLLIAILAALALPTMFHLTEMQVSRVQSMMSLSHEFGGPAMPECPDGYICPVKVAFFSPSGAFNPSASPSPQLLVLLTTIPVLLAFASTARHRHPPPILFPNDPKIALSTFKRE